MKTEYSYTVSYEQRLETGFFQRKGIIKVHEKVILANPKEVIAVLNDFLPTNVQFDYRTNKVRFEGLHPGFDILEEHETIPEYAVELTMLKKTYDQTVVRVTLKRK